jgi:hypothetical protein
MPPKTLTTPLPAQLMPTLCLAALCLALLPGCGKVTEMATQKATEKLIEAQVNKDGGNAQVKLGDGGVKVEGTDEQGKSFKMEMGSAKLTEADLDMPFYPGAKPTENGGTRIVNGDGAMLSQELSSTDAPAKVAAWYREQLKPRMAGNTVIDQAQDQGMSLSILPNKEGNSSLTVSVSADDQGSKIALMHSSQKKSP